MTRDEIESALLSTMGARGVGDADWPSRCDMTVWHATIEIATETSAQEATRGMRDVIDSECARGRWIL